MTMTTRFVSVRAIVIALATISFQPLPAAQTPAARTPQTSQTSPTSISSTSTSLTSPTSMTLDIDASDAPMKILHATMSMPAAAGPMTLFYPKWIPGEHMPSGPIANLTGLHFFADAREIDWRRDLVEVNAFRLTVPAGARTLTAKYDYVVPGGGGA